MTRAEALPATPAEDEEQSVLDYLGRHPDFFERHADWLAEQPLRHGSGAAVSLIERQVTVLREHNEKLRSRLDELLATARSNEERVKGLNLLAENLIRADSLASVIAGLAESLNRDFQVESVQLALFGEAREDAGACIWIQRDQIPEALQDFFRQGRVSCGPLSAPVAELLFPGHGELQSVAMVPLDRSAPLGLIALASTDPARFSPDMGELFLEMTAKLITAALHFHGVGESD